MAAGTWASLGAYGHAGIRVHLPGMGHCRILGCDTAVYGSLDGYMRAWTGVMSLDGYNEPGTGTNEPGTGNNEPGTVKCGPGTVKCGPGTVKCGPFP